jgi:Na+-driven multidrug efflux pump
MKHKIFNKKQKKILLFWIICTPILGYFLITNQYGKIDKIMNNFVTFNSILLGFVLTCFTIISSMLGEKVTKKLQETNAYYSLMTNFYWLMNLLFFNLIVSFILQFFDYQNSKFKSIYIDTLLIIDITLVFLLLWYAISRISRVMRSVNKITD